MNQSSKRYLDDEPVLVHVVNLVVLRPEGVATVGTPSSPKKYDQAPRTGFLIYRLGRLYDQRRRVRRAKEMRCCSPKAFNAYSRSLPCC